VPAFVALSPGTALSFKIAGSPATLNDKMLKSPLVAAAEADEARAATAAVRLNVRRTIARIDNLSDELLLQKALFQSKGQQKTYTLELNQGRDAHGFMEWPPEIELTHELKMLVGLS
jgi:hypothetical protein